MVRFVLSLFAVAAFCPTVSYAQMFPRLFGGKSVSQVGSACPGGVCPTSAVRSSYPAVGAMIAAPMKAVSNRAGHWSYPGDIDSHLEGTHGVSTAGMTREQKLNLHDSLHEGTSAPRANYAPVSYGSSGSRVGGYGSSGIRVGSVLPDGAVVTSVGVTVSQAPSVEAVEMRAMGASVGDRVKFRRSLLAAARKAKESGEITSLEFFVLSAASRNPVALNRMMEAVHEAAIEDGLASVNAVDWDSLIEFLEKLIPIIVKLIDLFS